MLTDLELGWLAGIIDGEGTICCLLSRRVKQAASRTIGMPCPHVAVQNTSKAMIDKLATLCEANGIHYALEPIGFRAKSTMPVYRITIHRKRDIAVLLNLIRPVLITKGEQAKTVIAWIEKWADCRGRGKATPTDAERLSFTESLSALNHGYGSIWEPLKPSTATAWPVTAGANAKNCEGLSESSNGQSAALGAEMAPGFNDHPLVGVESSDSKRLAPVLKIVGAG